MAKPAKKKTVIDEIVENAQQVIDTISGLEVSEEQLAFLSHLSGQVAAAAYMADLLSQLISSGGDEEEEEEASGEEEEVAEDEATDDDGGEEEEEEVADEDEDEVAEDGEEVEDVEDEEEAEEEAEEEIDFSTFKSGDVKTFLEGMGVAAPAGAKLPALREFCAKVQEKYDTFSEKSMDQLQKFAVKSKVTFTAKKKEDPEVAKDRLVKLLLSKQKFA